MKERENRKKVKEEATQKLMMPQKILKAESFLKECIIPEITECKKPPEGESIQIVMYIYPEDDLGIFSFDDVEVAADIAEKYGLKAEKVLKEDENCFCVFRRVY